MVEIMPATVNAPPAGSQAESMTTNNSDTPSSPRGRGRGRVRGLRANRGGRGRGRGQEQARDGAVGAGPFHSGTAPDSSYGRPPGGSFGTRLTEAASNIQGDLKALSSKAEVGKEAADEREVCFICASPIDHISIAPCNHQTCHICALRLRALYKTRACAHCRTESPFVIFTDNAEQHYQDFEVKDLVRTDENLGIKYEKDIILEDTILLLRYNCPDKDCDIACFGWPDLHRHVKSKHGKIMCDLCTRNKKVFTHEHELFTFGELRKHEKFGDDNPGAIDQSGFKGHPDCGFCRQRFYGDDELYTHCREKHERCHICDRRNGGRQPQYYRNYEELEKHFADAHFVCIDAECQANKTNVFESEMDLKAHQLSEHPHGMSKDVRRDARLVNLSGFEVRTPYQQPSRRTGGGGRDPNAEPLPVSSAQPLSRAEMAYQRQMAIQNAQPPPPRPAPSPRPQAARPAQQQPASTTSNIPPLENLSVSELSPQDRARQLRHQALVDRAAKLLDNSTPKIDQFRNQISSYRSSSISAADLIDGFFSLFDCPSSDLGILVRELADLYENEDKRKILLEAWNNWRSINEDYPDLPLPSGAATGSTADMGINVGSGRRVLKLKSSTAQSSRSKTARQGSWGNILSSTGSQHSGQPSTGGRGTEAFPSLPASRKPAPTLFNWASNPHPSTATASTNSNPRPTQSLNPRKPPTNTASAFPSLPMAAKPNVSMANFNTRPSGIHSSGTNTPRSVNAWGNGGTAPTPAQAAAAITAAAAADFDGDAAGESGVGGKKKGKKGKGKGEMLFHFG